VLNRGVVLPAVIVALAAIVLRAQDRSALDQQLEKGRQQLSYHEYFQALKEFQKANQLAGGKSADAFFGIAQATYGMKVYRNALDACRSAIDLAGSNVRLATRAHKLRGEVFQAMGQLADAEAEFRAALEIDPESAIADLHFLLGSVLMAQQRDEEGAVELRKEIEIRPNGTTAEEAQTLLANPRRAREKYVPEFSFAATNGETISLETLRGKIVLLDFWATWCAPCVRALPSVRKLSKDHAKDPFVVVGISHDRDETPWREFVSKNGMSWPQYWDRDRRMGAMFQITAIPTYILIDAEGIERMRVKGAGFHEARALGAEIEKQITLLARSLPSAPRH
jgi:tetratricopeptide (TPR) repeat protein